MCNLLLERVRPTEPAILSLISGHYSHLSNCRLRPRTDKTSKTWWSNARLVVFSDVGRTLVFAWQWPKDGIRKDGQNGFNNTVFHRAQTCPFQASEIILAAERAVIDHWGRNRAYTYVDPLAVKSVNPGYCYKIAGWTFERISKSGKHLLSKVLN